MSKAVVADVKIPSNFASYVAEQTVVKTPLFAAGVIQNVPGLSIVKGATLSMPSIKPLGGDDEILADNASLAVDGIVTAAEKAIVFNRGKAWSVNDLASGFAGEDFVGYIGSQIIQFRAERLNAHALATLSGACAAASFAANVHSTTTDFDKLGMIDAEFKLGDARGKLAIVLAHSETVRLMEVADLLDTVKGSESAPVRTYRGRPVIEMDTMPLETIYLVGQGALGYAEGLDLAAVETDRNILAGDTTLAARWSYVMHARGFRTTLDIAANGVTPSNALVGTGTSWQLVADHKNVPLVAYKFGQ